MSRKNAVVLWSMPILALVYRLIILISNTVTFHSDEAIVGLMARHINQGLPIPTFFYGQPYMGSIDPLLAAGMFRLFGEHVWSLRLPQPLLYTAIVAVLIALALRLTGSWRVALMTGLLTAIPPVVTVLYTATSLGGHSETLLIGCLILLVGYDMYDSHITSLRHWLALGALIGLGWWTYNLVVVFVLPVAVFLALRWRQVSWRMLVVMGAAFLIGSAPWWVYNLQHDWESVRFLIGGYQAGSTVKVSIADKLFGLLLFGLPAVMGVRFPWNIGVWAGIWAVPVVIGYGVLLTLSLLHTLRNRRSPGAEHFLWAMVIGFAVIFIVSGFGVDPTGRYLLPLAAAVALLIAMQVQRLSLRQRWVAIIIPVLVGVNLLGAVIAMRHMPPGLTPQFDPVTDIPNDSDQAVIDFLLTHGGQYGYSNYWVAYRLAFLSGEKVLLSPQLPYKVTLIYTGPDRYPAYTAVVDKAERPVLVTAMLPKLAQIIIQRLESQGISYQRQVIGPYTIFYDLSRRITPLELGLQSLDIAP